MKFKKNTIIFFIVLSFFGVFIFSFANPTEAQFQGLRNPLTSSSIRDITPADLYARILKAALGIIGVLSLIFFIWGGFLWMTAGGNQEKLKQGRDTLVWSIFGLAAIFASYVILSAVIDTLTKTTIQ